jgi:hypothetical protein
MGGCGNISHINVFAWQKLVIKALVEFDLFRCDLGTESAQFARFSFPLPEHETDNQHHLSGGAGPISQKSAFAEAAE